MASVPVEEQPSVLAECLVSLNHGQVYLLKDGSRRIAVQNGRGSLLYPFNIVPQRNASRLDIDWSQFTPSVTWTSCVKEPG